MRWLAREGGDLLLRIQNTAQHVVRRFQRAQIGFKTALRDNLVHSFFAQINVREFDLRRAIARVLQNRWACRVVLLDDWKDTPGVRFDEFGSGFLKTISIDVRHIVSRDLNLLGKCGQSREGGVDGGYHAAPPFD